MPRVGVDIMMTPGDIDKLQKECDFEYMKETIDKQQTQIRELIDKNKVVDLDYKEEYYKLQKENYKLKQKIEEWKGFLAKRVKKEGLKMFVFIIFETKGNFTIEYQIMTPHLCKMKIHDGILSRGKDIMPKIEKIFDKQ